jgi:hypothetical protein
MAVYSHRMMNDLYSSLSTMATTFFSRMPLMLDPDEFVAAFIAPEHVGKLRDVEELVGHVGTSNFGVDIAGTDGVKLPWTVVFGFRPPIILPAYVKGGLQSTCPDHVLDKITAWVDERVRFGRVFGDAYDALGELNEVCTDVRAISTMLPCFPVIMGSITEDADAKTSKRAQSLTQSKRFGQLPALPREVKSRLLEVSAIVSSVSLLKDSPIPETPKFHACIQRNPYGSQGSTRVNIFDGAKAMQVARRAAFM